MSFRDQALHERLKTAGDLAEQKCLEVYPVNLVRWGLDRPPLRVHELPVRVRYAPDFLATKCFVECQGFGRDQMFKLKWEKLNALLFWQTIHPVEFFIYDSHNNRYVTVGLKLITHFIDRGDAELGIFPEGRAYFAIPGGLFFP